MSISMERFGSEGNFATYDPFAAAVQKVAIFQIQCRCCGFEPEGDPWVAFAIGRQLEEEGDLEGSASAYDRAYGLDPAAEEVRQRRAAVLDRLAVVEHGLRFRYVPAGPFLLGCAQGGPAARPRRGLRHQGRSHCSCPVTSYAERRARAGSAASADRRAVDVDA